MHEWPIINADDLGISLDTNQAIVISFRKSWINSASLMANMPAFDQACSLIESEKLDGHIGVHLNLSAGRPLSALITRCPRFCDEQGMFRARTGSFWQAALNLSRSEQAAVREELGAQIRACTLRGLRPTHLDSHQHQHIEWGIGSIVSDLAREFDIPTVRIMRNCGPQGSMPKRLYRIMFNARLRRLALARSQYLGNIANTQSILGRCREVEVVVHPQMQNGTVVDSIDHPLEPLIAELRSFTKLSSS